MSDLTDFLLARIAEDEAWDAEHPHFSDGSAPDYVPPWWTRVGREVEAKRQIVDECERSILNDRDASSAEWIARVLATVWADHSDYRQEWKP